jgi:hypothetical protein
MMFTGAEGAIRWLGWCVGLERREHCTRTHGVIGLARACWKTLNSRSGEAIAFRSASTKAPESLQHLWDRNVRRPRHLAFHGVKSAL